MDTSEEMSNSHINICHSINNYTTWATGTANATLFSAIKDLITNQHQTYLAAQEGLKARILCLEGHVSALNQKLAKTVQPPLPTPPAKNANTTAQPEPGKPKPKATYAAAAKNSDANVPPSNKEDFNTVKRKKPARPTLIPKAIPERDREIVVELATNDNALTLTKDPSFHALIAVNDALNACKEFNLPPIQLARLTARKNFVLTTVPQQRAADYAPFTNVIKAAFKELPATEVRINERWTRFLVHGIPTFIKPEMAELELKYAYPTLEHARPMRWLTTFPQRQGKDHSTMMITLRGALTIKSLGTDRLLLGNRSCRLTAFHESNTFSMCNRCLEYGLGTQLCKCNPVDVRCAVCAQNHHSKDHKCTIPACKQGASCTHPPLKCFHCMGDHKANDPVCPKRPAAKIANKTTPPHPADAMTNDN